MKNIIEITEIQYTKYILTKPNGNIYSGNWINNHDLTSLNVKIKYKNSNYFVGEIFNNKYYGTFTYFNKDIYIGELIKREMKLKN